MHARNVTLAYETKKKKRGRIGANRLDLEEGVRERKDTEKSALYFTAVLVLRIEAGCDLALDHCTKCSSSSYPEQGNELTVYKFQ